jgi:Protein of unknown function (DUF1557).
MKLHKLIRLTIVLFICLQTAFSQAQSLKTIEPGIGFPQPLDKNKLMKEMQEIEKIRSNDENLLTDYQRWLVEMGYDERDIHDVGTWGDDWWNCASIKSISASSSLKPAGNLDYKAQNAHDDNLGTAWIEGVEGYGIGESITFCFPYRKHYDENGNYIESENDDEGPMPMDYSRQTVTTVFIYNGYMKSEKAWRDNSRVKQLKLYINEKPYALLNLKDIAAMQIFNIGNLSAIPELCLKFEITDIYKGDKYDDTAISEINFNGKGCLCFAKGTMIALPSGEKAIENLVVGDKVLTLNTKTNEVEEATVLELANRKHHNLYELDFENIKITVTDDHPFYFDGKYYSVTKNNTYGVMTNTLLEGQKINCLSNGKIQTIKLKNIKKLDICEETYTITKLDRNSLFFANGICVSIE